MEEGKELQKSEGGFLPQISFTREQIDLIKATVAKDTTDNELALFLYAAKKSGLDPLAKQIHCVKRSGKASFQVSIDGYRLIADRTGNYAGSDDPVLDDETAPKKATVTVYKIVHGMRVGFTSSARWSEYFPGEAQGFLWKKMPALMLSKCAEALALRKAFPAELSGLYTPEEMEQAGNVSHVEVVDAPKPATKAPAAPLDKESNLGLSVVTKIADVQKFEGKAKATGKAYAKFTVTDVHGTKYTTFDSAIATDAKDAKESGAEVLLSFSTDKFGNTVTAIALTEAAMEAEALA